MPPGSEEVEIVRSGAAAIEMLSDCVMVLFAASLTCTVNEELPDAVGVPESTPVDAARLKPAGSAPTVTLQVYGLVPPLACKVAK